MKNLTNLRKGLIPLLMGAMSLVPALSAERPPNIVFFFVDDLGWKDLNVYGGSFFDTPHADQLAAEGMRFTQAYASPTCSPTRANIVTGQSEARHGVWEVLGVLDRPYAKMTSPSRNITIPDEIVTYAQVLSAEGYVCGSIGKWHASRRPPTEYGFVPINEDIDDPALQQFAEENHHKGLGEIHAKSIEFIREHRDQPFFLAVNHYMVHAPLTARQDLIDKYHRKLRRTGVTNIHPAYAAMVEMTDNSLGLVKAELEALGLADNTIVVLYSDNGGLITDMYLGEPTPLATSLSPLRSQKGSLYEGGIRVPLIAKWPGRIEPGSVSNELVNSYDLFPTFIEMGGAQLPEGQVVDGISLVPLLTGETDSLGRDTLFWHFPTSMWTRSPGGVIRQGDYKLIEHFNDGSVELFNLAEDLGETVNLTRLRPERAEELLTALREWRASVGAELPTPNPDYDPTREQELGLPRWLQR